MDLRHRAGGLSEVVEGPLAAHTPTVTCQSQRMIARIKSPPDTRRRVSRLRRPDAECRGLLPMSYAAEVMSRSARCRGIPGPLSLETTDGVILPPQRAAAHRAAHQGRGAVRAWRNGAAARACPSRQGTLACRVRLRAGCLAHPLRLAERQIRVGKARAVARDRRRRTPASRGGCSN